MTKDELYNWAFTVLKPAADMAYQGTGTLKCGEHCRFCKAKANCRARAEYNLKLAHYDFKMPDTLEDIEIESLLGKLDGFIKWAEGIKEYALKEAVKGKKWNGYKLVKPARQKEVRRASQRSCCKTAGQAYFGTGV